MFTIVLGLIDETTITLEKVIKFVYEKDRYTPYTSFDFSALVDNISKEIVTVRVYSGENLLHFGTVDSFSVSSFGAKKLIRIFSSGFSKALIKNEPVPKMNYNVNLETLLSTNISLPNVDFQTDTAAANYIYVKEKSSLWDAVTALCLKTYSDLPFIRGNNSIRFTVPTAVKNLEIAYSLITEYADGTESSNLISHIHMQDVEGNYGNYDMSSSYATERNIIRHKYISFDKQWLSDTNIGLKYQLDISRRGAKFKKLTYRGFLNEDLLDRVVVVSDKFPVNHFVSRIRTTHDARGLLTTLWFYEDAYCNK